MCQIRPKRDPGFAPNNGSDADLVTTGSRRTDDARLDKIELAATVCKSLFGVRSKGKLRVGDEGLRQCGKCTNVCPVEAMALVSAGDPHKHKRKKARLDESLCLGCGVCVRACPNGSIKLQARPQRVLTPVTTAHRAVLMAIERGKLQNLIFDNQAHWNHRAMAAILGVILKLPPVKQIMASKQMKSRYLENLMRPRDFVHLAH